MSADMEAQIAKRYLNVPFDEKEHAKALGARWDQTERRWYVPPGLPIEDFGKWLDTPPGPTLTLDSGDGADAKGAYVYELINGDRSRILCRSDFMVPINCEFRYKGRFYRLVFCSPEEREAAARVLCVELDGVRAVYSEASKLRYADELTAFFAERRTRPGEVRIDTEAAIRELFLERLRPHFQVEEEVWGHHPTGKDLRIDAVLTPKDRKAWRNKEVSFGLEFKNPLAPPDSTGHRDSSIVAQCLDYSMCAFPRYPDMIVFLCPILPFLRKEASLFRLLRRYNVGYVDCDSKWGVRFMLGDLTLWSERKGVGDIGRKSMLPKVYGNRDADPETG